MRKNVVILEDKYLLNQKINNTQNKKNYFSFSYIPFLFIYTILILNLYFIIKLINYQKNKYNKLLRNENIANKDFYKNKSEEGKEKDNKNIKININNEHINFKNISMETYDLNILKLVENKIKDYVELIPNEQQFLHGLIRAMKPRKIVEIGISKGGSSVLILNAIKDMKGAKLFSIDKSVYCYRERNKKSGFLVKEKFPELMDKWTLYTGGLTSEFIETIGDGIDLVFIDTMHVTPGEMLDWLMVLPFLKSESIVVFHDTFISYYNRKVSKIKRHTSNDHLLCYIRGELILPHYGDSIFFRNIGALKLEPEQKKYYYQYFLALGIQWEYMPSEIDLKLMRDFFMKYYGKKYVEVYDDAVEKNKIYLNNFKKLK